VTTRTSGASARSGGRKGEILELVDTGMDAFDFPLYDAIGEASRRTTWRGSTRTPPSVSSTRTPTPS
jgi:hypothetical protein